MTTSFIILNHIYIIINIIFYSCNTTKSRTCTLYLQNYLIIMQLNYIIIIIIWNNSSSSIHAWLKKHKNCLNTRAQDHSINPPSTLFLYLNLFCPHFCSILFLCGKKVTKTKSKAK